MAKAAKETKPAAPAPLAVVQRPLPVSHALVGTLAERQAAFDHLAQQMASLQLNGWDTVQKAKAACWLADGLKEHPAIFMQNHFVMLIKGRMTVEPKWEYMIRKLKETVPGFRFKVLEEDAQHARVWMTDGVDEHDVSYSVEDARRQGLMGRDGAWTSGSTREMCLKQAVKRGARRLGVGREAVWVDIEGVPFDEDEPQKAGPAAEQAISEAVVVDEAPAGAEGESNEGAAPSSPEAPPAQEVVDARVRLSAMLAKQYGKQSKAVMLEKASFIYNEMVREETGSTPNPPVRYKRADEISPSDAERMLKFLEQREGRGTGEPDSTHGSMEAPPASEAEEAPPLEEEQATAPRIPAADAEGMYMVLAETVRRAQKLFAPRRFIVESPPQSKKFWFSDQTTVSQLGLTASVKLMVDGEVVASKELMHRLNTVLAEDCDKKERGGR